MIVAAEIKINGVVISMEMPARHHNILHQVHGLYEGIVALVGRPLWTYESQIEGFITDQGVFLDRKKAFIHAFESGQTLNRREGGYQGNELFSEDLW